jgi:PHD/YefM family antitoxin component YafN of YafNO toxin-antitoxin module
MNWSDVINFVEDSGGRVMIVDKDQPSLVVLSYRDYQKLIDSNDSQIISRDQARDGKEMEPLNRLYIDDLPL